MYYVYLHKKPDGSVFYVGKGKGLRCYSVHNRNPMWNATVKKYGFTVEIVESGLQEWYAFELEASLTYYYGLRSEGGTLVNMCYGGGGNNGYVFTDDVKAVISSKNSGLGNGRSDKTIYTFVRVNDCLEFTGTRQDFTDEHGIKVYDLFNSSGVLSVMGWCLKENAHNLSKTKFDPTVFTFVHDDGRVVVANRRDFKSQIGIDPRGLFRSSKYRNKSVKGWSLKMTN